MNKIIKWLFGYETSNIEESESSKIKRITCGERDKDGFADTYIDGKKTNVRLLLWDKEQIEELRKITEKIYKDYEKNN